MGHHHEQTIASQSSPFNQISHARTSKLSDAGSTLKVSKPNPEPIRFALKSINAKASEAIYAGDDKRDIDAANGADVFSVAVQWGYLGSPQPVQDWCADLIVHNPSEILGIELTK